MMKLTYMEHLHYAVNNKNKYNKTELAGVDCLHVHTLGCATLDTVTGC